MKRALRIQFLVGIFLFALTTLAGASSKWDSLNLLKNVKASKVDDGLIVRLEFEKPVSDYSEPEFFDKKNILKKFHKKYPKGMFRTVVDVIEDFRN